MGLLDRLRAAMGQRSISTVQLMQETGTRYMAWHGGLYDADVVRACIRPKAKAVGKLGGKAHPGGRWMRRGTEALP